MIEIEEHILEVMTPRCTHGEILRRLQDLGITLTSERLGSYLFSLYKYRFIEREVRPEKGPTRYFYSRVNE